MVGLVYENSVCGNRAFIFNILTSLDVGDIIMDRTTVYFVSAKGVASRHLFTHVYRILYTSPTKASTRFCLTDLFRSV